MDYYFAKTIEAAFEPTVEKVIGALQAGGFGLVSTIDVQQTLKNKLGVDFRPYRILGACNPALAYEALSVEDKIGTMLPCNVVVQSLGDGRTEVAAIDPVASMQAVGNPKLAATASGVRARLKAVVDSL